MFGSLNRWFYWTFYRPRCVMAPYLPLKPVGELVFLGKVPHVHLGNNTYFKVVVEIIIEKCSVKNSWYEEYVGGHFPYQSSYDHTETEWAIYSLPGGENEEGPAGWMMALKSDCSIKIIS